MKCQVLIDWLTFAVSFQNGVFQLHSTRDLQTMSFFVLIQFAQLILPYQIFEMSENYSFFSALSLF